MCPYKNFSYVYDVFMRDVPYNKWFLYIKKILDKYNYSPKTVLDMACGTGNMSIKLFEENFDVIGVDMSPDMLSVARAKADKINSNILFLNQDMRDLDLYGTVDLTICLFDSLNYILEINELTDIFRRVNNFLNPGGLFIFDLNTEYKFEKILSGNTFSDYTEDGVCIWESTYDSNAKICEYYTNFFIKEEDQKYLRFEELHYEKSYTIDEIIHAATKSGMQFLEVYDAFTFDKPKKDSERLYFVLKRKEKGNNEKGN